MLVNKDSYQRETIYLPVKLQTYSCLMVIYNILSVEMFSLILVLYSCLKYNDQQEKSQKVHPPQKEKNNYILSPR